jgi:hypothetical protein
MNTHTQTHTHTHTHTHTYFATLVDLLSFKMGITTETWSASITSNEGHRKRTQKATNRHRRYAHNA